MESKKINQLATELTPSLSDLTIIGDPSTGISKKITLSQMASLFTGTVEEYANLAAFPLVGVADTIYIALDTNVLYRWNTGTNAYVELSPNIINSLVFSDANGFDGNISLVGSVATLTITTALTTGSIPFIGASGALSQDNANLFFDDTNNRLGINTNAPTTALDIFGSGIIGRLNGTSTNNAYLGFASAGTNRWSIGNVQADHRFRIYNEATTSELVSVLSTGEFGIGIANPTTKVHIDGGATALIANLDANVSVAKSISFRSDNSNRINLEVSGTESGSNAGANFFIRRYSDVGALIDTPLTITRSTGIILAATSDFNISNTTPILRLTDSAATSNGGNVYLRAEKTGTGYNNLNYIGFQHIFKGGGSETTFLTIDSTGASTFANSIAAINATFSGTVGIGTATSPVADLQVGKSSGVTIAMSNSSSVTSGTRGGISWYNSSVSTVADIRAVAVTDNVGTELQFYTRPAAGSLTQVLTLGSTGAATFVSSLRAISPNITAPTLGSGSGAFFAAASNGLYGLYIGTSNDTGNSFIQNTRNDGSALAYNLFIQPNGGNVAIGSSTASYTLDVNGNCAATRFWVASGGNATDPMIRVKDDTDTGIFFPSANTMSFSTGANERMRIFSGGGLRIYGNLESLILQATTAGSEIYLGLYNSAGTRRCYIGYGGTPTTILDIWNTENGAIQFGTNSTLRMRVSEVGTLDVRANSNNVNGMSAIISRLGSNCDNTSSYGLIVETGGSNRCFIYGNGNIVNTNNSYGSISDNKLKENISDATEKLSDLLKIKVRNYNFIGDNKKQIGVIAQELEEIFPSMIDETEDYEEVEIKDEEGNINTEKQSLGTTTKSVKYSVFVPMLIKAIQEQQAQIEELKAKIK